MEVSMVFQLIVCLALLINGISIFMIARYLRKKA